MTDETQAPQRKKFNAQRSALRALGENAIEGFDFEIVKVEGGYIWKNLEPAKAQSGDDDAPPETEIAAERTPEQAAPVVYVSLADIEPSPLNPRRTFDEEAIDELAESIAANGLLQNLVVRPIEGGRYQLISGERRYRALVRLYDQERWGATEATIPVKVIIADDGDTLALALLENLQREAVNPMEEAEGMAALHRLDPTRWSTAEIGRRIGKTTRHVQLRLALTDRLTDDTRAALREGRINLAQARALTGMPAAIQAKTVKAIESEASWTRRAEDLRRGILSELIPADRAIFDPSAAGIDVVEDDDGGRWLERDAFRRLQKEAIEAKVAELAAEWAWAETTGWFFPADYEQERSEDRSVAGAVVIMEFGGTVRIETGLVRKQRATAAADHDEAVRIENHQRRQAAREELQARFWDGLHSDETAALALCAYGLLVHEDYVSPTNVDFIPNSPLTRALFERLAAFEWEAPDPDGNASLHFGPEDDRGGLFAELLRWSPARLAKLIAAIAADSVAVHTHTIEPHPVTAALAARFNVELPDFWQPEAEPATEPAD